jgi:phosphatidylinositol glycan class B
MATNDKPNIARVFLLLCIYRLANAWMIRTQFDPDEYWQTLEPAYCLAFGSPQNQLQASDVEPIYGCALTWEWTRRWAPSNDTLENHMPSFLLQAMHGPIRSHISILPTYWYYLACRTFFDWAERSSYEYVKHFVHRNATYMISKGPAFLHAVIIAAPTDLSLWLIALQLEKLGCTAKNGSSSSLAFWSLFLSLTSWFNGYALIRTYANCFETMCLALGIVLLGPVSP